MHVDCFLKPFIKPFDVPRLKARDNIFNFFLDKFFLDADFENLVLTKLSPTFLLLKPCIVFIISNVHHCANRISVHKDTRHCLAPGVEKFVEPELFWKVTRWNASIYMEKSFCRYALDVLENILPSIAKRLLIINANSFSRMTWKNYETAANTDLSCWVRDCGFVEGRKYLEELLKHKVSWTIPHCCFSFFSSF